MNSGLQKPCIKRPPGLSGPEVSSVGARPAARVSSGKTGLLGSLGFHGCLLAAACSITFMNAGEKGSAGDEPSGDPAGFEMKSTAPPAESEETVSSASSLPQPAVPVMVVNSPATVQLPPVEPMASITANTNKTTAAAPTPAATGKSSASGDHAAAKSTGRKGAGRGDVARRDSPVPPPKLLSAPPPGYPAAAKAARKSGKVGVLVRVKGNGSAAATSVYQSSGNPQLDQAAVDAARSWKFSATPSLGPGETVAVVVQVTFKL